MDTDRILGPLTKEQTRALAHDALATLEPEGFYALVREVAADCFDGVDELILALGGEPLGEASE